MIVYNSVDLEEIAPVKIEDIRVSPIELNPVSRQRAIGSGSEFVRTRHGTRTVTITFAIPVSDAEERNGYLQAITEWARSDEEGTLFLPHFTDRYLTATCTARPEPSYRQWWESKLRLVFTCFHNPYWTNADEVQVKNGQSFAPISTIPPLERITQTLSAAAGRQTYRVGSQEMTFSAIPAGNLVIDLNRQTAAVNGSSIMQYFLPSSRFILPKTGLQTYSGNGNLYYRERWL